MPGPGSATLSWIKLGHASSEEIRKLVDGGIRCEDIMDVRSTDPADATFKKVISNGKTEWIKVINEKAAAFLETHRYAAFINKVVAQKPEGMLLAMHLCRGNFKSTHAAAGNYEPVAEALLSEMDIDAYFLEYDDDRSGDFRPLRYLPKGKTVVLGLVTTKLGDMESKDDIKRRIDAAARYVPLFAAFFLYILFLQLASAHHLLAEPGLSASWKIVNTSYMMYLAVLGSMIHGLTVPGAIEAAQRRNGYTKGMFEWLRKAPWSNPASSDMSMATSFRWASPPEGAPSGWRGFLPC